MEIIGDVVRHIDDDEGYDVAELKRLGIDAQAKTYIVDHKDERGNYPLGLFGTGELVIDFPGQACVMLDRQEFVKLFVFLNQPRVKAVAMRILRASLIESSPEGAELIAELEAMSPQHKQQLLSAFGHGTPPAA